jgi:enterochelin esterase-like enzyme
MATPYSGIVPQSPPWFFEPKGRYDEHLFESEVLKGNPLKDPHQRPLWVYLPPGYEAEPQRRYPSIYVIQGLTGQIDMWRNRTPFRRNFPELADAQFAAGAAPPCILIYVDCWTSIGGSQYLDSAGTGKYHTYLCNEIVPWVDQHYRTLTEARHRGIMGKSSGGYGAMVTPMLRPDLFGGLATHAGDALFELSYANAFGKSVRTLTTTTAPSRSSGRISVAGRRSAGKGMESYSTTGVWHPAIPPMTTALCVCPTTPRPAR